tara:strand:- start:4697 stop:5545 length:849 start_codon:yes stop_codon:yes gene_type:complete
MIDTIKQVGIVGQGFVGKSLKKVFSQYYTINTYDKLAHERSTESIQELCECSDAIFVCVPTPMKSGGACDTSIVESVCREIADAQSDCIVVIKSTIPPGTTKRLNETFGGGRIVFNPEFLTERFAEKDFENTNRVLLGGEVEATTPLKQFYSRVFPNVTVIKTDSCTAEYVKYLSNCFLAVKVSVANEFAAMCKLSGVDYDKVTEYATFDPRLGNTHWVVPGPDGHNGFGGSCFPKDINAIIDFSTKLGAPCYTLLGAWTTNLVVRPEKDWEQLKGRAVVDD